MKTENYIIKQSLLLFFIVIIIPSIALAQLISLKTVPVATGDQFLFFPSQNLGMGGVSIALEDSTLDAFINPAKGVWMRGTNLIGSPTYYSISDNNGVGRTLPLGVMYGSSQWFGGFSLVLQELEPANISNFRIWGPRQQILSKKSSNNMYAFCILGKKLPNSNTTVGGSAFFADLSALDGVDLLYSGSQDIKQFGYIVDYRTGILGELSGGRSYEVLLIYNRLNMTHKVTYADWVWDPEFRRSVRVERLERNLDRTDTWGFHTGYIQPFGDAGWRIGSIVTINRKSHPKIPNYEIMNIPRDPGHSWAYNLGLGLSKIQGMATLGIDFIYEPIWSNTWADADSIVVTTSGKIIPVGGKTVENDFQFKNWLFRIGIRQEDDHIGLQLGLQLRSIRYRLEQQNNVEESQREQEEHWMEWTPTWGITLKFPEFDIRYVGRLTTGTGRPGVAWTWNGWERAGVFFDGADFIIAPSGALTLEEAEVVTHQISVSIPIHN